MSDNMILDGQGPGEATKTTNGKSRKMRAGFATLAVLGLGAGVTLAGFTGNVSFDGSVQHANPQLQGRVLNTPNQTGVVWQNVSTDGHVPLGNVVLDGPGDENTRYLQVKAVGWDIEGKNVTAVVNGLQDSGFVADVSSDWSFGTSSIDGSRYVSVPLTLTTVDNDMENLNTTPTEFHAVITVAGHP